MAAKCLKCVGTFKRFRGNWFWSEGNFAKAQLLFYFLVIFSHQEIVAGNTDFGVSKLYISCQYKLVICSAVLPFPPQNASGRTEAALVMLSEEALRVLPLITFLLLESSHWEKREAQVGSGEKLWVLLFISE